MKKKKDVMKDNGSFLGITSISMEETPIGMEIAAEFRYKCSKNDVVTFAIEFPGGAKASYTAVEATTEEVMAATSKAVILPKTEAKQGGRFILKGHLGKDKAIIAFSILNNGGEIIHS